MIGVNGYARVAGVVDLDDVVEGELAALAHHEDLVDGHHAAGDSFALEVEYAVDERALLLLDALGVLDELLDRVAAVLGGYLVAEN